jgi:hypothetical protein
MDPLLDAVDQIRGELEDAYPTETTVRLRDLTERLAEVGITMLATTVVMHEDLDRRFERLQRQRQKTTDGFSLRSRPNARRPP